MLRSLSNTLGKETHSFPSVFHWILVPGGSHCDIFPAQTSTMEQLSVNQTPPCKAGYTGCLFLPHHSLNTYSVPGVTEECNSLGAKPSESTVLLSSHTMQPRP